MSIHYFEGAAGTGKTFNLIITLKDTLLENPLSEYQKVLALTYMHGSRRRLEQKLSEIIDIKRKYNCLTFDSFAWEIIQRWNSLLNSIDDTDYRNVDQYEKTCLQAAKLFEKPAIRKWVSTTYPIIIIDEVQDLTESRFNILKGLSEYSCLIVAGDEFQNLNDENGSDNYLLWLKKNSSYNLLKEVHRTNDSGLLGISNCIRNGDGFLSLLNEGKFSKYLGNFKLKIAHSWQMLSWDIGYELFTKSKEEVVILTLKNNESDVEKALQKVMNKPQNLNKKAKTTFGPFPTLKRYVKDEDIANDFIKDLSLSGHQTCINELIRKCSKIDNKLIGNLLSSKLHRKKRLGITHLCQTEIYEFILEICRNRRIFRTSNNDKKQVMTIHQAKNREFDNVIIVWSYGFKTDSSEQKIRKLMYNAITRSKKSCMVILYGKKRLDEVPFS